jgi:hypothetical protein
MVKVPTVQVRARAIVLVVLLGVLVLCLYYSSTRSYRTMTTLYELIGLVLANVCTSIRVLIVVVLVVW